MGSVQVFQNLNRTESNWIETIFQNCMKDNDHHILLRSTSLPRKTAPTVGHYWKTLGFYRIREEYVENRWNPWYCIPTGSFGMSEYQCSYENHDQSDTFQYPTTCSQHPMPRIPTHFYRILTDGSVLSILFQTIVIYYAWVRLEICCSCFF